jgi:hypothetical protein
MTESDIRNRIIERLLINDTARDTVFFREMFIANFSRRADLVAVNGKLAAFEIKSAQDSLQRLSGQLPVYAEHFEQVTVVVATKHLIQLTGRLPRGVGLWEATSSGNFAEHRVARNRKVTKSNLLTFLPVDELRMLLRQQEKSSVGDRFTLLERANEVGYDAIRSYVLSFMKRRTARLEARIAERQNGLNRSTAAQTVSRVGDSLARFLAECRTTGSMKATPRRVS